MDRTLLTALRSIWHTTEGVVEKSITCPATSAWGSGANARMRETMPG